MDLLTPSSPGGFQTLSLTTNSSRLPWGMVAMPLISPLMPVPHVKYLTNRHKPNTSAASCSRSVVTAWWLLSNSECCFCKSLSARSNSSRSLHMNTHIHACMNVVLFFTSQIHSSSTVCTEKLHLRLRTSALRNSTAHSAVYPVTVCAGRTLPATKFGRFCLEKYCNFANCLLVLRHLKLN